MRALMRAYDWSNTPFGAVDQWPQSLCAALSICLNSRFPIAIYWGPDCLLLYNDAWRPIAGDKHPWSLGRSAYEVWPEIWDDIGPEFDKVFATGEGSFHGDELLALNRFGYTEECFFDYTFNPIQGQGGRVDGIFNVVIETTYRVLGDRRAQLLRELAARTGSAKTVHETCMDLVAAIKSDLADIPLSLLYIIRDDGQTADLCGATERELPYAPKQVSLEEENGLEGWPIAAVAQRAQPHRVDDLVDRFGSLPGSPWPEPPQEAMVLPIVLSGQTRVSGVLVVVASPRRRLDEAYRDFFEQIAGQMAAAIANARAHEDERWRTEQLTEQKRLLELVASGQPLDDCLKAVCTTVSQLNPHVRACFLLTDTPGQRFTRSIAPDFSASFRKALKGMPIGDLRLGTCFEAVSCGEPVTCADVATDDRWASVWRDLCLAHDIRACHSTPLFDLAGQPLGSLMLCFDRAQAPSQREYDLADFGTQIARIALERDRTTLALLKSEQRYHTLFESMDQGFCICELLLDDQGNPADYRFLEVNPAFEALTGFQQAAGKTAQELMPDFASFWIEVYGQVALTGEPHQFEHESMAMGRWFDVSVFAVGKPERHRFALLFTNITDRKRIESHLRESEERFRSMADNAPVMVWVTDPTGHCTYLSQSWYAFTGQTEETGHGLGWLDAVHPEDTPFAKQTFITANERQEGFRLEYRLRSKDGTYHWAIDTANPWLGAEGQFNGFIGSVLDISDRKQIEETLRQRETELSLVTNAIPALIAFIDADQRYRFNNQGYEEWFGQPATAIYGKHLREVVGDETYERVRPYVEKVLAGEPVTFERSIVFKDGSTRYVSATYVPRFNDQQVVEGFVALIHDFSDRKQAELALSQSEARYRYLVESIPQLVWTANAEGAILDVNQRWCDYTGLTLERANAEGWQVLVHAEDLPILTQNWAIAQQQGSNYQAEGRMKRADGVYRWHLHQAVPLKNAQGQVIKWFGTATDIEDQKQLEHQRSQMLQQEQAARAAAEAASRTKDEFLAVVSHELRSPLNPILGWATLLQNGTLSEAKTKQALAVIERNAKLQTELIDDLLDVSRMLRGKLQISASPVSLAATIRAAIETVRLSAEAKAIQIATHLDANVGLISGDATRLQQVVWNLLSNAVKFTPAAGRIEVHLIQSDANQAQITVTDSGRGITPEFLPMIFDYFRQADSATTRQFGGLGLGLAIVRHLVELHGGTIAAASPGEGQGATFTVSLPTLTQTPDAEDNSPPLPPAINLQGTRVLVVDDDTDTRTFITFMLEQARASVVVAASASEALAVLKDAQPQVIVSDIGMPKMDGYMMMRQIRTLPAEQGGQIPAIALTAYVREADQEQSLAAGFQRHIAKPVEPAALLRAIAALLQP